MSPGFLGFRGKARSTFESQRRESLPLRLSERRRLFWFDDNDRIRMSVFVILGGGVVRIEQAFAVYQELVSVLAGR